MSEFMDICQVRTYTHPLSPLASTKYDSTPTELYVGLPVGRVVVELLEAWDGSAKLLHQGCQVQTVVPVRLWQKEEEG